MRVILTDWFCYEILSIMSSDLKPRHATLAVSANGSCVQAVPDESLCFVALAVLFFVGIVINCDIYRKASQGSGV